MLTLKAMKELTDEAYLIDKKIKKMQKEFKAKKALLMENCKKKNIKELSGVKGQFKVSDKVEFVTDAYELSKVVTKKVFIELVKPQNGLIEKAIKSGLVSGSVIDSVTEKNEIEFHCIKFKKA
jgi:dsDNA-specific endonuclease/ATPase MutS2